MSYKWKPNASQRKQFAERMQDPEEKQAYQQRKQAKRGYENFDKKDFVPTETQYRHAMEMMGKGGLTPEQIDACNQVSYGYGCKEKIPHPYIHIINEHHRQTLAQAFN